MSDLSTHNPVKHDVVVPLAPSAAFDLFVSRMNDFWPRTHKIGSSSMVEAVLEPNAGGRWYERGEDGGECDWGRVLVWEPPSRLTLNWQINADWKFDPDLTTEVDIRFLAVGENVTQVILEHGNMDRFGSQENAVRAAFDSPGGWPGILARYRDLAA